MVERFLYTNRLIHEKSPYLLQHAHNPVDWYSWGEEAFTQAKIQDKPVFLSIGYAACHWCHVMERESFKDPEIARLLNETFINIKLDREELPEVDSLYMEFAQGMMAGAAGWPLNLILTPDLKPFFAATYLPPSSKHGFMGLVELVHRIREVWHGEERETVLEEADKVVELFAENVHAKGEAFPEREILQDAADTLFRIADPVYGGIKGVPKFPIGYQYNFMLRYAALHKDNRAFFLVERSLDMMHRGGIYDHLGGGFSRYSVDESWMVPHFEKMLYDNALLADAYLESWQVTKNPFYKEVCEEILDYVLREMAHSEGGFYSAQDAESEGKEGLYYTWTPQEIEEITGKEAAELFCSFYGVVEEGNFEGRSVLHITESPAAFAQTRKMELIELSNRLLGIRQQLWLARNRRIPPFKDDKILTAWNGMMISVMAKAGCAFEIQRYLEAAFKAVKFIRNHLWRDGVLLRRWREGEAGYEGSLEEYVFLIQGLLYAFEADGGSDYLEWALILTQKVKELFKEEGGAFYQTNEKNQHLILRACQFADGAEPSGNAIHCENLLRLYQLTWESDYLEQAKDIFKAVDKYLNTYAPGYCYHLLNLIRYYDKHSPTLVVALNEESEHKEQIMKAIYSNFIPHKAVIWRHLGDERLLKLLPSVKQQEPIQNRTTLYICYQGVCQKPLVDKEIVQGIKDISLIS